MCVCQVHNCALKKQVEAGAVKNTLRLILSSHFAENLDLCASTQEQKKNLPAHGMKTPIHASHPKEWLLGCEMRF